MKIRNTLKWNDTIVVSMESGSWEVDLSFDMETLELVEIEMNQNGADWFATSSVTVVKNNIKAARDQAKRFKDSL